MEQIYKEGEENIDKKTEKLEYEDRLKQISFLFFNPKSGSEEGAFIKSIAEKQNKSKNNKMKRIEFDDGSGNMATSFIFNIIEKEEYNLGQDHLKKYIELCKDENDKIKVLIAGGDGSVLSLVEDFYSYQIDLGKCIFAHIPLGTGNDLANALGFGSNS